MEMLSTTKIFAAAFAAIFLTAGLAHAGVDVVDPNEPRPVIPVATGAAAVAAAPGSARAIAVTRQLANTFAVRAVAQRVPALTAAQRAAARAQLMEIIAATGGSPELRTLAAAIEAAPSAE